MLVHQLSRRVIDENRRSQSLDFLDPAPFAVIVVGRGPVVALLPVLQVVGVRVAGPILRQISGRIVRAGGLAGMMWIVLTAKQPVVIGIECGLRLRRQRRITHVGSGIYPPVPVPVIAIRLRPGSDLISLLQSVQSIIRVALLLAEARCRDRLTEHVPIVVCRAVGIIQA